jgi:hypothetical protein
MSRFSRCLAVLVFLQTFLAIAHAQTATVNPANEGAAYIGQYATVEGVVAKVFTSKTVNTPLSKVSASKSLAGSRCLLIQVENAGGCLA